MSTMPRYSNPYIMGALLGLVLLFAYYTMGRGVGSSSTFARVGIGTVAAIAPEHAKTNAFMSAFTQTGRSIFMEWLVFLTVGAALGGLFSAFVGRRLSFEIARGPSIGAGARLWLALGGGIISGFAARLARGCTSGQALTGAPELALGSWVFMFCIFAGAYGAAYFFRKEWL